MRKANKEITDQAVLNEILNTCTVGRLGTIARDGSPMVKPLNFVFHDNAIYFHSARAGEKIDDIMRDNRVCFEMELSIAFLKGTLEDPCKAEYLYRSIIIRGRALQIEDRVERIAALTALMHKYQPSGGYGDFLEEKLSITAVVRIDIEEMVGKENLGKDRTREAVISALHSGARLPIVLMDPTGSKG